MLGRRIRQGKLVTRSELEAERLAHYVRQLTLRELWAWKMAGALIEITKRSAKNGRA